MYSSTVAFFLKRPVSGSEYYLTDILPTLFLRKPIRHRSVTGSLVNEDGGFNILICSVLGPPRSGRLVRIESHDSSLNLLLASLERNGTVIQK